MENGNYNPKCKGKYIRKDGVLSPDEVCDILASLVRAKSVNPKEYECGEKIIEICEREGLNYEIVPVYEDENNEKASRFNIMITLGAESYLSEKIGLLIHGHYDTVPVMEMEDPFGAEIKDNLMFGRGIVDQKSGLAAALCAMIALKRSGIVLRKPLCIAAVVDEESEHRGSYILGQSNIKADYAIVTEPTNADRCEFGCRGTAPIKITVKGKTAHAGTPWKGINSIEKSVPVLEELFSMSFPEADIEELGSLKSTLCVSLIQGGSAYNNVPGETIIWMDRRTIPGETQKTALDEIEAAVKKVSEKCRELDAKVEIARPDWKWQPIIERGLNPTITDPECPLYDILAEEGRKCGIKRIEKSLFEGYNDMDFLVNDLGIPTLVYGPGDAGMCHAPVEYVDIDQVCAVAEIFCGTVETLLG